MRPSQTKRRRSSVLPRPVRHLDRRASDGAYSWPSPQAVDSALRTLSNVAGTPWFWVGSAALLATTGPTGRTAAGSGLVSLGVASGLVNLVAKRLIRQHRPHGHGFRHGRRPGGVPRTAALPSGHSATAAAFATAVWLRSPARGAAAASVAGLAAYSRLHLGQHWFSDVIVGAAAGAVTAIALHHLAGTTPLER